MFNSLSEKLESAFKHLKGQARINDLNVANEMADVLKAENEARYPGVEFEVHKLPTRRPDPRFPDDPYDARKDRKMMRGDY